MNRRALVESDPIRVCELLVGRPAISVLGVVSRENEPLRVHVERMGSVARCLVCGVAAHVKDRGQVELGDLPSVGRTTRLIWRQRRIRRPEPSRPHDSRTEQDPLFAPRRPCRSDRAGRWITERLARRGRSVAVVPKELGCDAHTVNDALLAAAAATRLGLVEALGLDGVLFVGEGE